MPLFGVMPLREKNERPYRGIPLIGLMPVLCAAHEVMFRLQHGRLHREHTIARGEGICDWVMGDKTKESE